MQPSASMPTMSRAAAFLIHDGVLPSNEGRGYVLRKIMRRAIRNARMIGRTEPYLTSLTDFVAELMKPGYPEMIESIHRVARSRHGGGASLRHHVPGGRKSLPDEAKSAAGGVLPGAAAFKLYDTYGLALDEQEEMARERGLTIDHDGFHAEMEKQRTRARAPLEGRRQSQIVPEVYRCFRPPSSSAAKRLNPPSPSSSVIEHDGNTELVFDRTPFYAETGGQVGDTGVLLSPSTGETVAIVRRHL